MQSIHYKDRKLLPNVSAVYAVKSEKEVLYVGSTWTLRKRFTSHSQKFAFETYKANLIEWIEVSNENLVETERLWIRELKPTLNKTASRKTKKREHQHSNYFIFAGPSMRDEALDLLKQYMEGKPVEKTFATIANEIEVSISWLNHFIKGKINNPGVITIETLVEYLKTQNAKVAC
jgi:excinuclease UvrABC nuclease subunit